MSCHGLRTRPVCVPWWMLRRIPAFLWPPLDEGSAAFPKKRILFLWSYLQVSLHTSGMWGTNFHSWCSLMQMSSYISLHFYWILWWQSKKGEQGVCPNMSGGEHSIHHRAKIMVTYLVNPGMRTSQLAIITTITQCWCSRSPPKETPQHMFPIHFTAYLGAHIQRIPKFQAQYVQGHSDCFFVAFSVQKWSKKKKLFSLCRLISERETNSNPAILASRFATCWVLAK